MPEERKGAPFLLGEAGKGLRLWRDGTAHLSSGEGEQTRFLAPRWAGGGGRAGGDVWTRCVCWQGHAPCVCRRDTPRRPGGEQQGTAIAIAVQSLVLPLPALLIPLVVHVHTVGTCSHPGWASEVISALKESYNSQ